MKKISQDWYQVRIFTKNLRKSKDTEYFWSVDIIGDIVKKFTETYPKVRFWFTKYYCPLSADGVDSEGLPTEFLDVKSDCIWSRSLRFRFKPTDKKQISFLKNLLDDKKESYWYKKIVEYNHMDDLCGQRFSGSKKIKDRKRRGDIVQHMLEYNSRLILDCIYLQDNEWKIETSDDPNNRAFGNISRSITHLIVNPWVNSVGQSLPIYGVDWSAIYWI